MATNMIKKIAFTMYPVKDMAKARAFYEGVLGLKCTENYQDSWVEYDLPGGCFAISTMVEGVSPSATAGGSIAFETADVKKSVEELKAKGVKVKVEPFATPVCKIAVIFDADGNAVTLHQLTDV